MKSSIANGENRGSINDILLKALQTGDKYGYEINKEIEAKSKGKFFLKEASLYSGLKRLQNNGYITSYWKDGELGMRRHYYSITEKGLEKLNSSNFTWDDSKTFIKEMFQDSPIIKNIKNEQNIIGSNLKQEEINENNDQKTTNNDNSDEVKKNPFQIEVSPLQQSIFDLNFNEKKEENIVKEKFQTIESEENKDFIEKEQTSNELNGKDIINSNPEDKLEVKENAEKVLEIETKKQYSQVKYEDILNLSQNNSYSDSLFKVEEKIDIGKYLSQEKENDSNIIIDKKIIKKDKVALSIEEKRDDNSNEEQTLEKKLEETELPKNFEDKTEILIDKDEIKSNESNVDIKNIFGSLLVEESQENNEIKEEKTINQNVLEEEIEQPIIKKELPRINVENDINITLAANKIKTNSTPQIKRDDVIIPSGSNNTPSVKQYINNVHKKTLISRATTVEEEVNLDGINIREYRKMNNKAIKNSNYIYKNRLNLFLVVLVSSLLICESIISFIVFNNLKCLAIFEILLLSIIIIGSLSLSYYYAYAYFKDKFKVELKNYNFKNTLFYCILMFVVIMIIFICLNIFQGMNTNNLNDFIVKIIFESLLSFNILLFPIIKKLFYGLRYFSN